MYICHMSKPSWSFAIDYKILCMNRNKATLTSKHLDTAYCSLLNSSIQRHWHQPFLFSLPNKLQMCLLWRGQNQKTKGRTFNVAIWIWVDSGHMSGRAVLFPRRMHAPVHSTGLQWHRGQKWWGQAKSRVFNTGQNYALTAQLRSSVLAFPSTTDGSYKNTVYPQLHFFLRILRNMVA